MGFLCLAALYSQSTYVAAKLAELPWLERASTASKILHQILPSEDISPLVGRDLPPLRPGLISMLLEHRADPNYRQAIWSNMICRVKKSNAPRVQLNFVQIMLLLVKAGAREDTKLLTRGDSIGGEWVVEKNIAPYYRQEASELLAEMNLQGMMRKSERGDGVSRTKDSSIHTIQQPANAHLPAPDSVEVIIEAEIMLPSKRDQTGSRMTSWGPGFFKGIFNGG